MNKQANFQKGKLEGKQIFFLCVCIFLNFYFFSSSAFTQAISANAGTDQTICMFDTTTIGGTPAVIGGNSPYTYSWQPTSGLDLPNNPNPQAYPASPVNYTLTVTDGDGNISQDVVAISHNPLPTVSAGPDQTIIGGSNTILQGSSGTINYYWFPTSGLTNENTATPTAEPGSTTTYCVAGQDANGCVNYDCMILEVIPSDIVTLYNAFTPNGDGNNDVLFIGNIQKFPDNKLEVFNRNGKLVFQTSQYANTWDGKVDGAELPSATYYVVLNLGSGKGKVQGAVTIIR